MNFIEFILDNIFFVAIAVIVIFNLFGGQSKKKTRDETTRKTSQNKPSSNTFGPEKKSLRRFENIGNKIEEKLEEYTKQFENETKTARKTIAEQRQDQYERLKENIQTTSRQVENRVKETKLYEDGLEQAKSMEGLPTIKSHHQPAEVGDLNLHERLSARGLIDSVIMAEVLGPPRARKAYQNIAQQRIRR